MTASPYDILGVDKLATKAEIKAAYRKLCKEFHPDKGGTAEDMARINDAYNLLCDPKRRMKYDKDGQTSDPGFKKRFEQFAADQLMDIISKQDSLESVDVLELFNMKVEKCINDVFAQRDEFKLKVNKVTRVKSRMLSKGDDSLEFVFNKWMETLETNLALIADEIEFLKKVQETLEKYSYLMPNRGIQNYC